MPTNKTEKNIKPETSKKTGTAKKKTSDKTKKAAAVNNEEKTEEKEELAFMHSQPKSRKKEVSVLKQLYQSADSEKSSIENVMKKIRDSSLKNTLLSQYERYDLISQKVSKELTKNGETQKDNFLNKAMLWSTINLNTLFDKSTAHIADMMIKENNAGIISLNKGLNEYRDDLSDSANSLAVEFLTAQQQAIDELKPYL